MRIEVARIPDEGMDLTGEDEGIVFRAADEGFESSGPVRYTFHVNYVSGELIVRGALSVEVACACSKCAVSFKNVVEDRRFDFINEAPDGTESVDLTEAMREAILCAFPTHPVCSDECRGLCVVCGKDLNEGECECAPVKDDHWSGLSDLKL